MVDKVEARSPSVKMLPSHHPYLLIIVCALCTSTAATLDPVRNKRLATRQNRKVVTVAAAGAVGGFGTIHRYTEPSTTPISIPENFVSYKSLKKCADVCLDSNPVEDLAAREEYNFCVMVHLGQFVCCNYSIQICKTFAENEKYLRKELETIPIGPGVPIFGGSKCQNKPCRNGGSCMERMEEETINVIYWCVCLTNFSGLHCELKDDVEHQVNRTSCREDVGESGPRTCYHGKCRTPPSKIITAQFEDMTIFADPVDVIPQMAPWNRMTITEGRKRQYADALFSLYIFQNSKVCLCYPGYRGLDCKRDCKPGTWGFYCLLRCDPHCQNGLCDDKTGTCDCSDGYAVDEETASCLPDFQPGQCKRLCEDVGRGKCHGEDCHCNEEGIGGHYCENSCSNFTRPRYGKNCAMPCGPCTIQPCDPVSGVCPVPSNNKPRCQLMFKGDKCMSNLDRILTSELNVQFKLYQDDYADVGKYARDMEELLNSVDSRQTLVDDLNLGFSREPEIMLSDYNLQLDNADKRKKRKGVRGRSARKLLQNDDSRIRVSFVASAPALYYKAAKLERVVTEGVLTMSRTFRTALAPGLRIDKHSIKVSKARMVRTSSQNVEDGTKGVSIILFGVLLGLVALMAVCIASACYVNKRTKTTVRSRTLKISRQPTRK